MGRGGEIMQSLRQLKTNYFNEVKPTKRIVLACCIVLFLVWWSSLPNKLFNSPTSTVIESNSGQLLGAYIATDGQWRFPELAEMPEKYQTCLLAFEDRYFFYHLGVNPLAIGRALVQNINNDRVVSGGSTITMQTIRLSRKNKARTISEKLIEMLLAFRMECTYSKSEILKKYASNAPFGGNVVGLDAAAWKYFGRQAKDLSWAESAMLAVLPNAPSLMYPGKRNEHLLAKRNRLLDKLYALGKIDETTLELSKLEAIPQQTYAIPQLAPHLLSRVLNEHEGERVRTTIDVDLQRHVNDIVRHHLVALRANKVYNAAVLVVDVAHGEALAYVGNSPDRGEGKHSEQVDVIRSPRSSGSILKPFLYAATQDAGVILPETLLLDIPTQIGGFSPQNFDLKYEGAVSASQALAKSLNIPVVRLLRTYGVEPFYLKLQQLQLSTINRSADNYGLSLILGGAEVNMWDLTGAYASMARILVHYEKNDGSILKQDFRVPSYIKQSYSTEVATEMPISPGAAWLTFQALLKVNRPDEEAGWDVFSSAKRIAWKTGTSFGFRDAWAVGTNKQYVVAVWCGNADGEGRPGLTGTTVAAPLLFDVFNQLPSTGWFTQPADEMERIAVCSKSGCRLGLYCDQADTTWVMPAGLNTEACSYHQLLHLDSTAHWQVSSACYPVDKMVHRSWFVLPPVAAWYYKSRNPYYESKPPFMPGCAEGQQQKIMETIYPRENNSLFVPIQLDGSEGVVVLEAAHANPDATIYWHFDGEFLGETHDVHKMPISPKAGEHLITLIDDKGNVFSKQVMVVEKKVEKL